MRNCEIIEVDFFDEERGKYLIVYGLRFFPTGNKGKTVRIVEDVFCKKHDAILAAEMINEDGIAEVHIDDILEDMIIEWVSLNIIMDSYQPYRRKLLENR